MNIPTEFTLICTIIIILLLFGVTYIKNDYNRLSPKNLFKKYFDFMLVTMSQAEDYSYQYAILYNQPFTYNFYTINHRIVFQKMICGNFIKVYVKGNLKEIAILKEDIKGKFHLIHKVEKQELYNLLLKENINK